MSRRVQVAVDVVATPDGLELRRSADSRGVRLDLDDVARRLREGSRLALARACGARPGLRVLDAMAGVGADAVVLACLGCDVTAIEGSPLVCRVLVDGVRRAATRFDIDGRVRCVEGDALDALRRGDCFDVVYLDPMFPARRKGALPRLKAQLLADVALPLEIDVATLVDVARVRARERVVLKRRGRDPSVAAPDWQIRGTRVRFDVYRGRGCSGGA